MLKVDSAPVKVRDINPRSETHGEKDVLAVDLSFEWKAHNKTLDDLSPGLLGALYAPDESPQTEMEQVEGLLPVVRFPKLQEGKTYAWAEEAKHQRVRVHLGGDGHDLVFVDCTVDKLTIAVAEGGTVAYTFRAIVHPSQEQYASLLGMVTGKNCHLTIDADPEFANEVQPDLAPPEDWPFPATAGSPVSLPLEALPVADGKAEAAPEVKPKPESKPKPSAKPPPAKKPAAPPAKKAANGKGAAA